MPKADDLVGPLQEQLRTLGETRRDLRQEINDYDRELFLTRGGCTRCEGRGWVVTWDTLDCIQGSYAEYGSCTEESCTQETRSKSGMSPRCSKYDRNKGTTVPASGSPEQVQQKKSLLKQITDLEFKIRETYETWTPDVNKVVKITSAGAGPKSRQNKVGAVGLVIKKFCNSWGTEKLIIIDEDGNKHWPSIKKVEVIDPSPDVSKYDTVLAAERQKNGLPVVVTIKAKSAKAALILTTTNKETWVPISQAPDLKDCVKGDTLSAVLPLWLIKKNSLI